MKAALLELVTTRPRLTIAGATLLIALANLLILLLSVYGVLGDISR